MATDQPPDDPDFPGEPVFLDGESILPSWPTAGRTHGGDGKGGTISLGGLHLSRWLMSQRFDYRRRPASED